MSEGGNRILEIIQKSEEVYDDSFADSFSISLDSLHDDDFDECIILPPPNVTGNLHIGHALDLFIQDLLIRFKAFCGIRVMWIPGTDHAGISTQMVVKKKLESEGIIDLSTEKLVSKIWEWKTFYEASIISQLKSLKCMLSWEKYRFSFDSFMEKRVSEAFCRLYERGFIFRDKRIVNWDVTLQTAISDIEVLEKKSLAKLWYIKYQLEDGNYLQIATTRPETLFADEAIMVNPKDPRYMHLYDKYAFIPIINKRIPIIFDERCEIEKGSGAVKIDPAHSVVDFEIGKKFRLPIEQIIDKYGKMCGNVPKDLLGLDRFKAREEVVKLLKALSAIEKEEIIENFLPYGSKSESIIEPFLTEQWFLDMPKASKELIKLADDKKIEFFPSFFETLYRQYAENLQPWCISRQIAWGHRIPIWYSERGEVIASTTEQEASIKARGAMTQDTDVLDTWFSSALWPMTTLGWPDQMNPKLYPNEFLVTGRDILLFWVTKMIFMHIVLVDKNSSPFKKVYLHGLIKDADGSKMSKSKGNVVDPLEISSSEGVDVLRFALLYSSLSGKDTKFSGTNVDHSRKFLIKISNAMSFCFTNFNPSVQLSIGQKVKHKVNIWMIKSIYSLEKELLDYIKEFRVRDFAVKVYDFFWNEFCDWYLEAVKYLIKTEYELETRYCIEIFVNRLLKMMHPLVPCITEYFWVKFGNKKNIIQNYKQVDLIYEEDDSFYMIKRIVSSIRSICSNLRLPRDLKIFVDLFSLQEDAELIRSMCNRNISFQKPEEIGFLKFSFHGIMLYVPDKFDSVDLVQAIQKIIISITEEIKLIEKKLSNDGFLENANSDEIEKIRIRLTELRKDLKIYSSN